MSLYTRIIKRLIWLYYLSVDNVLFYPRILWCRFWYLFDIKRISRKESRGQRIRVLFVVTCTAKWKSQKIYEAMKKTDIYDPIVCMSRPDWGGGATDEERKKFFNECIDFFKERGMKCEIVYDLDRKKPRSLLELKPDIVFYQQSWFNVRGQLPYNVAHRALTCYVPYYVPNYGIVTIDTQLPLHRLLWRYFVLNDVWADIFKAANKGRLYAGCFVGTGHPTLDEYIRDDQTVSKRSCVIYAPHWTFGYDGVEHDSLRYGTFEWNGREILKYAKCHQEIEWVFKPHPNFRSTLVKSGLMTKDEVDSYYAEWNTIGRCCTNGDYAELFNQSTAMITDCGSFLTEYAVTGKPLIHLISNDCKVPVLEPLRKLYSTYYRVQNINELKQTLENIVEKKRDPLRDVRMRAVDEAELVHGDAAQNILQYLSKECR